MSPHFLEPENRSNFTQNERKNMSKHISMCETAQKEIAQWIRILRNRQTIVIRLKMKAKISVSTSVCSEVGTNELPTLLFT
jgi:hypothetical protein